MKGTKKEYSISIYHDTRSVKKNGKYPLKLRVFSSSTKKRKLYPLNYEFTILEFKEAWTEPKKAFKEVRLEIQTIEGKAEQVAKTIIPFTFTEFESEFFGNNSKDVNDISTFYKRKINELNKNEQIGTSSSYELSLKSLLKFHNKDRDKSKEQPISFYDIDKNWLTAYERYMTKEGKSKATIGIYLRPMRAIFKSAIKDRTISEKLYPFGADKYKIPTSSKVKKALPKDKLKLLFNGTPQNEFQEKAKDFWFFSFACNGMNFKDIVNLRYSNIEGDTLTFIREKTKNTTNDSKPVSVHLTAHTKQVIEKYGNKNTSSQNLIFPIIDNPNKLIESRTQLKNFIRFVNQHLVNYAKSLGIEDKISTYWARHSYATQSIQNGASMEFVSEALSHSNMITTQKYFAGFEDETIKEMANKLMDL